MLKRLFITIVVFACFANVIAQVNTAMEVNVHKISLPKSTKISSGELYKIFYPDINIFHVEINEKNNQIKIISRPQVSRENIEANLKKNKVNFSALQSEKIIMEAYEVEQKALERNRQKQILNIK
ncbi:MAG: hypothetical protein RMJ53_00420 [Chitinophagales bacterium]|nr:hypothetical protein [Chitinophagales bacterium]